MRRRADSSCSAACSRCSRPASIACWSTSFMVRRAARSIPDAAPAEVPAWRASISANHPVGGSTDSWIAPRSSDPTVFSRRTVDQAELVGGVLYGAEDPVVAGRALVELLSSDHVDEGRARAAGLEPVLVSSLKRKL